MTVILESLVAALAGAAFEFIRNWLADRRAASAQQQVGQLTAERDQAIEGRDAAERISKAAVDPLGEDDALKRMAGGGA